MVLNASKFWFLGGFACMVVQSLVGGIFFGVDFGRVGWVDQAGWEGLGFWDGAAVY